MFSPSIQNMIEQYDYPVLDEAALESFTASNEEVVLFLTQDAQRFPETDDVAMILPELVKAFGGRFCAVVIAMADQRKLQLRYGFTQWPTLVFLRNGEYLGAISKVQDWQTYLVEIERILASEPSSPPAFPLPKGGGGSNCHA